MKKTVIVGVSSGIAAFKALDLIKELRSNGLEIYVVMTEHATQMVDIRDFEKASGNKVYVDLFEKGFDYKKVLKERKVEHIEIADKADLMVVVPATANIIGKLAHGFADDFLTTSALAVTAPILICPSMNVNMWNNPIVQENILSLQKNRFQIIEPAEGLLACGYEGKGRLKEISLIADEVMRVLQRTQMLEGKKIIVTAGGTIEKIDEARLVANRSSGKMGVAIAEECYLRGAEVVLLRAKSSVKPRYIIPEKIFETGTDLQKLIEQEVEKADVIFHAAAVSDFIPTESFEGKISSKNGFSLKLKPTIKIVNQIKKLNPKIKLIAFKAEYGLTGQELIKTAIAKLKETGADLVVANEIGKGDRGFEVNTNEVIVVLQNGEYAKLPLSSKRAIAKGIVDLIT